MDAVYSCFARVNPDRLLVRFLSRRLSDAEEARDIAQDALYNMMQVKDAEHLEHARAYLFQTAANLALNRIRKRKCHDRYVQEVGVSEPNEQDGTLASPERAAAARQQLDLVEAALRQLPEKCRRAFLLHRSRHRTYRQIATEMGVSVSAIEKYISTALEHCRKTVRWDPTLD